MAADAWIVEGIWKFQSKINTFANISLLENIWWSCRECAGDGFSLILPYLKLKSQYMKITQSLKMKTSLTTRLNSNYALYAQSKEYRDPHSTN